MISEWKVERIQLGSKPKYRVWRRSHRGVEFLLEGFSDEQAQFKRRADADECVRQLNRARAADAGGKEGQP